MSLKPSSLKGQLRSSLGMSFPARTFQALRLVLCRDVFSQTRGDFLTYVPIYFPAFRS